MKKIDLTDLINRKKILKESLDIIKESINGMDEIGGFDTPDLAAHYHGNYVDELIKLFFKYDELSDSLGNIISKTVDDDEIKHSKEILTHYVNFMESYLTYVNYLTEKHIDKIKDYENKPYKSNLGDNGDFGNIKDFRLNENRKRSR
jgi:hypothetical protein